MIIIGTNKAKLINPTQIVSLELVKGKTSVYAKGDTDGDNIQVKELSVREPWTVVVKTSRETSYINSKDFNTALSDMIGLSMKAYPDSDPVKIERVLRQKYGKAKEAQSK